MSDLIPAWVKDPASAYAAIKKLRQENQRLREENQELKALPANRALEALKQFKARFDTLLTETFDR